MSELSEALEQLPITAEFRFRGIGSWDSQHENLQWLVTLQYQGRKYACHTFKNGFGPDSTNDPPLSFRCAEGACLPYNQCNWRKDRTIFGAVFRKEWLADPRSRKPPELADVVSCLLSDVQHGQMAFEDYCSEFGLNADSRSTYAVWESCKATALGMHQLLGADLYLLENKSH